MFAIVIHPCRESVSDAMPPRASHAKQPPNEEGGVPAFHHSVSVAHDGPQGQPVQELRFVVSFQEASTISRHVPAAQYLKWMGRMRELVTSVNVPGLVDLIATGEWGLVTNWGDVHVFGELTANDVVQMRFWTNPAQDSEVEFFCDFWRQRPDGSWEQAAFAEQKATWVRLIGHGQVAAEPFPQELADFIDRMGPKEGASVSARALPRTLNHLQRGQPLFQATAGPNRAPKLLAKIVPTTLEEANLVGNVYFANYFSWQRKVRDLFLHAISPTYHHGIGAAGEMICLRSRMDYLREAMPFDDVQVQMTLQSLHESAATFGFEFSRVPAQGRPQKLSVGRHEVVWVTRDAEGLPQATAWPEDVRATLLSKQPRESSPPALSAENQPSLPLTVF